MRTKTRNILIAVFILAVILMAALNWYMNREVPEEDVYVPAMNKLVQASTAELEIDVNTFLNPADFMGGTDGLADSVDVPITISGPLALSFPVNGKVSGQTSLDFEAGFGIAKLFHLETVIIESGATYAKISDLPNELGDSLDIADLAESWFSVRGADLELVFSQMKSADALGEPTDVLEINANAFRYALSGLFVPYRRYDNTIIRGQAAAHYEMAVNNDRLIELFCLVVSAARNGVCSPEQKTALTEYVHSRKLMAEAWINLSSKDLQIIKLGIFPHEGSSGMPVALTLSFGELDAPVKTVAPADARPISVVLMKVLRVSAASFNN